MSMPPLSTTTLLDVHVDDAGAFQRADSDFREMPGFEAGRYHLYVSPACPWCHRVMIVREVCGLADALPTSWVKPWRDQRGWAFGDDGFADPVEGMSFMSEAYQRSRPGYDHHVSVPVLWDRREHRIVNNESSDLVRLLPTWSGGPDLYPEDLRPEIDTINERIYETVNNGVYRAGFARSQGAYEKAFGEVFASLEWIEGLLGARRYLAGDRITEADWRLFPTLVRFDPVYHTHFRCNGKRIVDYPNLWGYARELYQQPGVAGTIEMDQIKTHYYTTHDELNPKHIIPLGPLGEDWSAPHGRQRRRAVAP
jgi:putative glutathione S-transferase